MLKGSLLIVLCVLSAGVYAEELTDEKKRVIDELLEITGAAKIGEMMGTAVANQMISALIEQDGNLDPRLVEIVKDETAKIMHDEFIANRWINEMAYGVYHKYLSTAELKELVAFYKTPTGSKVVAVLPRITQESMLLGQVQGLSLGPVIQQRLKARLEREGFKSAD